MNYNVHKICRVCLKEGALTSIYSTEFSMMPCTMLMLCAKVHIYRKDGLPEVICNNCIYRLGVAYHFKQECENSDIRLRQYLGLPSRDYGICDAETNTEVIWQNICNKTQLNATVANQSTDSDMEEDEDNTKPLKRKSKRRTRYQRKPPEEHKKRGPKPLPKLPPTCYECNKTFKCTAQLQMHIRTHTGEKPYACHYCPRRFTQKYNLHIHERTHTGDKPFVCEICSKQFSAMGNFQAHLKIHSGIRDQHCPVCQKSFYTAGDLSKHMVTHTGIKNHHCDICGKAFSRRRDMESHKKKLHQLPISLTERSDDEDDEIVDAVVTDAFKCPDCNKEFDSAGSLSVHFRTHATASNLLNLPFGGSAQMLPPPLPPPPSSHHYHPHAPHPHHHAHQVGTITALGAPSHPHHHDGLHAHHLTSSHHLTLNAASLHGTNTETTGMSISHMHSTHGLPPPPIDTTTNSLTMMHTAHRLHPY